MKINQKRRLSIDLILSFGLMLSPSMVSKADNVALNKPVIDFSSQYGASGFEASNVTDGSIRDEFLQNYWITDSGEGLDAFFTLDLQGVFQITEIGLRNTHNAANNDRGSGGFHILASTVVDAFNHLVDPTVILSGELSNVAGLDPITPDVFTAANGLIVGNYRYLKFVVDSLAPYAVNTQSAGLNEIEVTGTPFGVISPSVQTVAVGESATFLVTVNHPEVIGYRWRKGGKDLSDGGTVSGVTTAVLTVNPTALSDSGYYDVEITTPLGSVASVGATLNVLAPPLILASPSSLLAVADESISLSVAVSGSGPIYYQWRRHGTNLANGDDLSGATTDSITIHKLRVADAAAYDVVVSNAVGVVVSSKAMLTVLSGTPHVIDLGAQTNITELGGVNNAGQVIGQYATRNNRARSFIWQAGVFQTLEAPADTCATVALSLSESGIVGGRFGGGCTTDGTDGPVGAVIWTSPEHFSIARQSDGLTPYDAWIADVGGYASGNGYAASPFGVAYRFGPDLVLHRFDHLITGLPESAGAISIRSGNSTTLVGRMSVGGFGNAAVAVSIDRANHLTVLSDPGAYNSSAEVINESGSIAGIIGGTAVLWSNNVPRALWTGEPRVWDINNRDQVLGTRFPDGPVLWHNGSTITIQHLFGLNPAWRLENTPFGMNDNGWLLDHARFQGGEMRSVIVILAPYITENPTSKTVLRGESVTFSATVEGVAPFTFQWRRNGTNVVDDENVSGSKTATLTVSSARGVDQGIYAVVVSNLFSSLIISSNATLKVQLPPLKTGWLGGIPHFSWATSDAALEHATHPLGPWFPVINATSPFAPNPTNGAGYFRLNAP